MFVYSHAQAIRFKLQSFSGLILSLFFLFSITYAGMVKYACWMMSDGGGRAMSGANWVSYESKRDPKMIHADQGSSSILCNMCLLLSAVMPSASHAVPYHAFV